MPPQPQILTREESLTALGHYLAILPPRWANQQVVISTYITLCAAILALSITGAQASAGEWPGSFLVTGPLAAGVIADLAKKTIAKQEKHIREVIVVVAKLEAALGLDKIVQTEPGSPRFWPADHSLLPTSWMSSRTRDQTSEAFINGPLGGTSKASCTAFTLIQILALIIAVMVVILALGPE